MSPELADIGTGAPDTPRTIRDGRGQPPYGRAMVPLGLLAIIALGLVVAYVVPQRARERAEYGLVRTEDRYSAQMRVVKSSATRLEHAPARPSSDSGELPLLVTGAQRAEHMSRPAAPLDRAATYAQREHLALRRDRSQVLAERAAQARRRATVAGAMAVLTATAWILVATVGLAAVVGAIVTAGLMAVVGVGARAASAQRAADARMLAVTREVEAAATATQALRVVSRERAAGHEVQPSDIATQAIRVLTAEDLAPLAAPAPVPAPELPVRAESPATVEDRGWSPSGVPAPAYTLKSTVTPRQARPLTEDDYDAGAVRAARWSEFTGSAASEAESASTTPAVPAEAPAPEPSTTTAALDAILARRRASA